ncbi:MAG: hypothetical protein ABF651_08140 [Sporolactobacillus sp.]
MGSIIYARKCPCCGRSAVEECFYKTDELFIYCLRCGYNYTKIIESETENNVEYREEKYDGNGFFCLVNKDGSRENMMLNEITDEQLEAYRVSCLDDKVDPERSYLVSYKDGVIHHLIRQSA